MDKKHSKAAPYYVFYNAIKSAPSTHNQPLSINFEDLLDSSLGSLEMSLQLTFLLDIDWLLNKYRVAGCGDKPLTILYGDKDLPPNVINRKKRNVKVHLIHPLYSVGNQHSKMAVLCYKDGSLRVVVSTANLRAEDWDYRTQSVWVSPKCPPLADPSDFNAGESPTGFKNCLLEYLNEYKMNCLNKFICKIKKTDFSAINVFFVGSVPGLHFDDQWALPRVRNLLSTHCVIPQMENHLWDLVVQSSSVGRYQTDPEFWLCGEFQTSFCKAVVAYGMASQRSPSLKFIYPSENNYMNSYKYFSVSYTRKVHDEQLWLEPMLCQWSAVNSDRSAALPHMKSYLRISPDAKNAAYYLLTSANVSRSAWGTMKDHFKIKVNSFEAGVLFIPKFVVAKDFFSIDIDDEDKLPVPYDLPPIPYSSEDKIFIPKLYGSY